MHQAYPPTSALTLPRLPTHPRQELEERQREVAAQGESMADTRPVARLAAACEQLRSELARMEVRRGVLQAALLSAAGRAT